MACSPGSRDLKFHDLGCGARAFDRRVLEEIQLYGDQHRFLAVLADRQGFRVREVDVQQSPKDRYTGVYEPREYTRSLLDIFTVFFLVRFTKKPLRFFGMVGVTTFVVGALLVAWLVIERLFFGQPLAERPALLLSSLLVVLGLQLFALGLLGELIIFTHARAIKDYQVERVIQFPAAGARTTAPEDRRPDAAARPHNGVGGATSRRLAGDARYSSSFRRLSSFRIPVKAIAVPGTTVLGLLRNASRRSTVHTPPRARSAGEYWKFGDGGHGTADDSAQVGPHGGGAPRSDVAAGARAID